MTKLNAEQHALIEQVERKWARYKAESTGIEARIRKRIEAEAKEGLRVAKLELAESIRVALDGGATKVALRAVTSKNPGTLESFLDVVTERTPATADGVNELDALSIAWTPGGQLDITLDAAAVRETDEDRTDPLLWSGVYEAFTRPSDGKVFIDPTEDNGGSLGVTEWLRADRANEEAVIAWIQNNPA